MRRLIGRRPVVLLALAVLALGETGCCGGPCGGFFTRTGAAVRNVSAAVFRPFRCKSGNCYSYGGPGYELGTEAPPLQYGTPAVVTPAPAASGGTVIETPGAASPLPSAPVEPDAGNLKPIPSAEETKPFATPGPPPGNEVAPSQGAKNNAGKANYEAARARSRNGQGRSGALARSPGEAADPVARSAKGSSAAKPAEGNPLDNLPPLELPRDGDETPAAAPRAAASPRADSTDLTEVPLPAAPAEAVADRSADTRLKPAEPNSARGIKRIVGVESKLAGGTVPTSEGLDWLVERGYKTLIDLREESDVPSTFPTEVKRRGLRYVSIPVSLKDMTPELVSRFHFEVSLADARPLFFCDTDGVRAAVMWFVRRVEVDKVDAQVARRDAEELGLPDPSLLAPAQAYLARQKPDGRVPEPAPLTPAEPDNTPTPGPAPATPGEGD